jgi:uncharacterized protein YggE
MSRLWIFAFAFLLPAVAVAQVHAIPDAPHLLVKGHAEGRYVPDRFDIDILVSVTDKRPELAREKVETHMRQIFAGLAKSGAVEKDTQASSLRIAPETSYRNGESVFVGTRVSRSVSATFDNLDKLRGFIAMLPANSEVQVQGTHTWRSDIDAIRLALRKQAIANAQQAAHKIAAAYGMHIKGVYSVSEVAPDFAYGIQAGSWGRSDGAVPALPPAPPAPPAPSLVKATGNLRADLRAGNIEVQQNIYAVYLTAP